MKQKDIEYEDIPLTDNEVREAQYKFDDHKLQILSHENKIELLQYQLDNDIPKSIARNKVIEMKKDIKRMEEDFEKLDKGEEDLVKKMSDEEIKDRKIVLVSTIKSCKQKIKEEELKIYLNLPSRDINQVLSSAEKETKRLKDNMRAHHNAVRNKTRRVARPRVQLSEKGE